MARGKYERLNAIIEQLLDKSNGSVSSCVVTNERGLIVTGLANDGSSNQDLAAMIALFSDTATRVNTNLGFGHPRTASIDSFGVSIAMHEFLVRNHWFRIGAIMQNNGRRLTFFRRKMTRRKLEHYLETTAKRVRRVLESS